ncbi:MAG: RagB/SusD family nutrient uptake outer membrane protein [Longimicrobiales bacterium]|nr:RagB/SusD family nutrient uptake outer membrane protein [Longimicrobiales bacterium]
MKGSTKFIAIGIVAVATMAWGCDDFLEAPPKGQLDALTLANGDGVEATLIGAYAMLGGWIPGVGGWGASASNWPFGSVPSDDAYKGTEAADQPDINPIELYQWSTGGAESYLNDKWRSLYEGVTRTNATIRLLNEVEQIPGELTEAQANSIRGEALFLRAHYHFEAWKVWRNIPYYTEEDTDFRKANIDGEQVISMILADLEQAIDLLPTEVRNGEVGRADQWTAKAYKGRVEVYSGDYSSGLTTLRDVVDNGPYALEENFHRVWTGFSEYANGPETILAYQASVNDGDPNGDNSNWGERLNFPHSGSPFGCCGFHQPSQNLVNFFVVDANGLPAAIGGGDLTPLTATEPWNANDAEMDAAATATMTVDPRLDWTVGRDDVPYKDWGTHAPSWIRNEAYGGPYSPKKHVHEQASNAQSNVGWNAQHLNSVNIHLYRYADLLLLLAEAEVEAGTPENARPLVNQIRARAGMVAQGPVDNMVVPIDDPSITWADYEIGLYPAGSFTDQAYARSAVRYERRLELAMEGHRLFDLQRWGIHPQVLNDYVSVEQNRRPYLPAAAAVAQRHAYYPIPPVQIELSQVEGENRLVQNDGW